MSKMLHAIRNTCCQARANQRQTAMSPQDKHRQRSSSAREDTSSADVLTSRTTSAADASAQAAKFKVLRQRRLPQADSLDSTCVAGDYTSALLSALATSDAAASAGAGAARRKTPQKRKRRKRALMERVKLHAAYLQPAVDAEFTEEWQASEARLQLSRAALQV